MMALILAALLAGFVGDAAVLSPDANIAPMVLADGGDDPPPNPKP